MTKRKSTPAAQGAAVQASETVEKEALNNGMISESGVAVTPVAGTEPAPAIPTPAAAPAEAPAAPEPAPAESNTEADGEGKVNLIADLMKQTNSDVLFENTKEEFFTQLDLAVHSEGGKKDNVITHKKTTEV